MSKTDGVPAVTQNALDELKVTRTFVIGGVGVIGSEALKQLPQPERIFGSNRYQTSVAVAEQFGVTGQRMYVATGLGFADAISGGVLAARNGSGVLLVGSTLPSTTENYLDDTEINSAVIFGGTAAVSIPAEMGLWGIEVRVQEVYLGMSEAALIKELGQPAKKEASGYSFTWYVYNQDYANFIMVGVVNGRVVSIYSNNGDWMTRNAVGIGTTEKKTRAAYSDFLETVNTQHLRYRNAEIDVTFFLDVHAANGKAVTSVWLSERNTRSASGPQPSRSVIERQALDLVNATRVRFGRQALSWCSKAGTSARLHSEEMVKYNYLSHDSKNGDTFMDRMHDAGVICKGGAENIAAGYTRVIFAHEALMNSSGHRNNILNAKWTHLGVGMEHGTSSNTYGTYYTQNYYQF